MDELTSESSNQQSSPQADARILGQLLAAQNFLFVLPDKTRVAEFFSEALNRVPGVTSGLVCLGGLPVPTGSANQVCHECVTLRKMDGETPVLPSDFSCEWAAREDVCSIRVKTNEHTFGFFTLRTDARDTIEPYVPFLNNLANYVALSLENRMQKLFLERARDDLEYKVEERTRELISANDALNASRFATLNLMQEAIKARQHIERVNADLEREVLERKQAEEALHRLNRELRAISDCNQTLLRAVDEQTLLNEICHIVCDQAGYRMAWVGFVEHDEIKTVRPVAWAGVEDGYLTTANITWADTERGHGPSGRAIRSGEPCYIQDFLTDPLAAPWRENAIQRGYRSSIALPLKDENANVCGILCLYSTQTNAFAPDEIHLMEELAGDLAYGITTLRTRAERKRVEDALRERERHAQSLLRLSKQLEQAQTFSEILDAASTEVRDTLGYQNLWVYLMSEDKQHMKALFAGGPMAQDVMSEEGIATLTIAGDRMLEEIVSTKKMVIVKDAQTDARTDKAIVARMGNRTIINVPILLFDKHLGAVGTGTFGDEGVRVPTLSEEEFLMALASHLAVSLVRVHSANERERADIALRESKERFRAVADSANEGIMSVDEQGIIFYWNKAACAIFGYTEEEILGKSLTTLMPELYHERYLNALRQMVTRGEQRVVGRTIQANGLRKDNTRVPLELSVASWQMRGKTFFTGMIRDITERKRAEETMNLQSAALQAAANGIVITDRQGIIRWINPAFTQLTGYMAEEAIGKNPRFLKSGKQNREFYRNLWNTILSGQVWQSEIVNRRKDGSLYTEEMIVAPLRQAEDVITHFIAIKQDITERKQHENEREAIIRISNALRAANTRAEMLPILLDQVTEMFHADNATLGLQDPVTGEIIFDGGRSIGGEKFNGTRLAPGQGVSAMVIASGKPYLNNDVRQDLRFIPLGQLDQANAVACAPLISQERPIGVLWINRRSNISETELHLLVAIADIAANAIRRVTLYEQTIQQLRRQSALHQIDTAISSSLDLHVTLNVLLNNTINLLSVDAADVLLLDPHSQNLDYAAGCGFLTHNIERSRLHLGQGQAGTAALERRLIAVPDINQSEITFKLAALLADEQFVSHFCAPLIAKGQIKGVLEVFHRSRLDPQPEWFGFFETLATQAAIAIDNATLFDNLQSSNMELKLAYDATIEGWSRALDLRDKETEGHTQRVVELSLRLAQALGIKDEALTHIRRGALLHDIGKMGIPDNILLKTGPLTPEEEIIMRKHPTYARDLILPIAFLRPALDVPYCHHEKWNGSGYPRGLKGEQIPLAARAFAVVDVWDALSSDRPYRRAWSKEQAHIYIREQSGIHFDPCMVEAFFALLETAT